jgi:hypothetical protein
MIDYALVFIYGSFVAIVGVGIGTIVRPLFERQKK